MRSETLGRSALLLAVLWMWTGCDSDSPPAPPTDAGRRDAGSQRDAGPMDGGEDAGPTDGGMDAGTDGGPVDAGPPDGGPDAGPEGGVVELDGSLPDIDGDLRDGGFTPGTDAGPCDFPDGGRNLCGCPDGLACVDDSVCPSQQTCTVDPGCGPNRCGLRGHRCGVDADCPSGSTCARGGRHGVCVPAGSACTDLRDCPTGYSCDSGSCVARRVPCGELDDCPWGYFCSQETPGSPFCVRGPRRCSTSEACPASYQCVDVDGDSLGECMGLGTCRNADCPAGQVCGTMPAGAQGCGLVGLCQSSSDCASSHECLDLAGDGVTECVRRGGSCSRQTDCPAGAICAAPGPEETPRCIDAPL